MKKEIKKRLCRETKDWSRKQFIDAMADLMEELAWYEMILEGISGRDCGDLLDEDDAADKWEVS